MNEKARHPLLRRDEIPALLHGHGITPTQQRVEIAAILLECKQHLAADQVIARLGEADASVSKATVYNTLGLFAERGLVREVMVDATRVFYDSNTAPHHHFFDVDDGELTDFPSDAVRIERLPALPPGTVADSVDVVIRVRKANR
jgi:Fur family iron response transcriptional regulator